MKGDSFACVFWEAEENDGLSKSKELVEACMKRKNRGTGGEDFFSSSLGSLKGEQEGVLEREKEVETESNEEGFICLRLLGGKFFTIKYPLPSAFFSFVTIEAC